MEWRQTHRWGQTTAVGGGEGVEGGSRKEKGLRDTGNSVVNVGGAGCRGLTGNGKIQ